MNNMFKLAPSILAADFCRLGSQLNILKQAGAHYVHIDVMDGHFVPNISIGVPVVESVRRYTDMTLDVHLMIENPERYVEAFAKAGADIINFHLEASRDPSGLIRRIRELGKSPAMTVKPGTDIEAALPFVNELDMLLIMSVEPGFGGQKFQEESLVKARRLRDYAGVGLDIEIDGGINLGNIRDAVRSGVNVAVAGSAVLGAKDIAAAVKEFYSAANRSL